MEKGGEGIPSRARGKRAAKILLAQRETQSEPRSDSDLVDRLNNLRQHTTLDESIFNRQLVLDNDIHVSLKLDNTRFTALGLSGSLKNLFSDLTTASNDPAADLTQQEKTLLDLKLLENCAYITGQDFIADLNKIPLSNEAEWVARCHDKLSEFFRRFETWEASSVGSAQIDHRINVDRIFAFNIDEPGFFPWISELGCWPFLFIESQPASIIDSGKEGDFWKMPIIQAFGWEQQEGVIEKLNLPEDYHAAHVQLPITFGIYYTGSIVQISTYFYRDNVKHYCTFKQMDLKTDATRILRMFAIIKNYINLMYKTVQDAVDTGTWTRPARRVTLKQSKLNEGKSDKTESKQSESPSSAKQIRNLYKNHRTSVDLVHNKQQQYVVKTTKFELGKQEYIVLNHLRGLSTVPMLLSKPVNSGNNTTILAMSWCQGEHPHNFTTRAELQTFMKALLQALQQIHKRGIVHNDIKESNIIWNSTTGDVYLIDFGCATTYPGETNAYTPGYCAEDSIKTPASDLYSAGIVMMNLILNIRIELSQQAVELSNCLSLKQALDWKSFCATISHGEAVLCCDKSFDLARQIVKERAIIDPFRT